MNGLTLSLLFTLKVLLNTDPEVNTLSNTFTSLYIIEDSLSVDEYLPVLVSDSLLIDPDSASLANSQVTLLTLDTFRTQQIINEFIIPFKGKVISRFGIRRGRMHAGTDIKLHLGDTVIASFNGIVTRASGYYGYGKLVVINHLNGLETFYGHLSKLLVKSGDTVITGQPVGLGGRTGRATTEHLHFEIRENGKPYNTELVFDYEKGFIRPEILSGTSLAELTGKLKTVKQVDNLGPDSEYTIKAGDSLWMIARRFGTTVSSICHLNQITPSSVLKIGRILRISDQETTK